MGASFRASRLFAFCIGILSVGEICANRLKTGFAWPQGLTVDYAWMAEEVVEWMEGEHSTALARPETSPMVGQ